MWCSGYGPRWPAKVEVIAFDNAEAAIAVQLSIDVPHDPKKRSEPPAGHPEDTEPYCVSFYAEKTSAWVSEARGASLSAFNESLVQQLGVPCVCLERP